MPLVARTALAVVTGLLAGFSLSERSAILCATVLAAPAFAALFARRPAAGSWGALAAVSAGAVLVAIAAARREHACLTSLATLSEWELRVDAPAEEGGVARGALSGAGCSTRGTVLVASGRATPGDVLRVTGEAAADAMSNTMSGAQPLLIQHGHLERVGPDAPMPRLRASAGARIDRLFGVDAPMVRALVIADMSAISAEQRDRYANAGLVHMLSVSGLHVGIIAFALQLLCSMLRLPRAHSGVATMVLLAAYVAAIGAPPPAVRAAVMLAVLLGSRLRQWPTSPWAVLAIGATIPLVAPRTVQDLGWQLSVAGTAALISGGALARRVVPKKWRGHRRTIASGIVISLVATTVTAPLVAWSFGRIALLGPVTNLLADPVMGVLQPVLFLALCIPVRPVERLTADAAHALIAAFDAIARAASSVPHAAPSVVPTVHSALLAGIGAAAMLVACAAREPVRAWLVSATAVALLVADPLIAPMRARTELHMLDVGQGDAIALRTRAGRWIVVDAGRSWIGGDAGKSTVVPYLAHRGGEVSLFVLSHPHADHVGGAASLFAALHPTRFLDPGYVGTTPPYLAALDEAARDHIPWQRVRPGDSLVVDEVVLTALAPDSAWAAQLADANLASTVIVARIGAVRVLLTGDAEGPEEDWLLRRDPSALAADILKVGHHGSSTSTTPEFLAAVQPRLALVSVGAHNAYGHPDASVMQALHESGAQVLRTDRAGTIVVTTDGTSIDVEARDERWTVPQVRRRE